MTTTLAQRVQAWLARPDADARARWLDQQPILDDELLRAMKAAADTELKCAPQRCFDLGIAILEAARRTGLPLHSAWGEMACANALLYLGSYQEAIVHCDAAQQLCLEAEEPVEAARSQIAKVFALMCIGAYDEGLEVAQGCYETLSTHGAWLSASRAAMNAANILQRQGRVEEALDAFGRAEQACARAGEQAAGELLRINHNRAFLLIVANHYRPAREALLHNYHEALRLGYRVLAARDALALGHISHALGEYNEALVLFDQAREAFAVEGMRHDVLVSRTHALHCAFALNLHQRVLAETAELLPEFRKIDGPYELAQAIYIRGLSLLALSRIAEADEAFESAGSLFEQQGAPVWLARCLVARGQVRLRQYDSAGALDLGSRAEAIFAARGLAIDGAQARLLVAEALRLQQGEPAAATYFAQVLELARDHDLPWLVVPAAAALGELDEAAGKLRRASELYAEAIEAVEHLRQHVMFEYRSSLLEDKETLYAAAVRVCLELGDDRGAFSFAERGKSRTLLDLLAGRVNVHLRVRSPDDQALLDEIERLREEQRWYFNQLHRHPDAGEIFDETKQQELRAALHARENMLERLLERLYVRNADYTRDATLFPGQPLVAERRVPSELALVEYYLLDDEVLAFVQEHGSLEVVRGLARRDEIERLLRALRLNLAACTGSTIQRSAALALQIRRLLARGYDLLLRPIERHLGHVRHLVIVPHGALHYLPFHALFDGERYMIERYACSYLPAGHLLPFYTGDEPHADAPSLALGHSMDGRLPGAIDEARDVAGLLGATLYLEDEAVRQKLGGGMRRPAIHIATHAEFRQDLPIFSALCLADGPLTAADLFQSSLPTGLLTLSACDTGGLRIDGGDELLGLIRACLYAGASSVVLSHWKVDDAAARRLMVHFYAALSAGETRIGALRSAQCSFLESEDYAHPIYWAPFFLVGAWGSLPLMNAQSAHL